MISDFIEAIGKENVLLNEEVAQRYEHIWQMSTPLKAKAVLLPHSTEDVASILKICNKNLQSVVVHGGLTNLVGSTETHEEDVVISLEKLNKIEEIDVQSRTMTVQSGVILENIQQAAKEKSLLFPLNFGAKGSAQIGGVISTNAGGLRVFKYGMTRNLVLGLESVLADGTIISSLKKIIKDNSGYDLKQLFIGAEGTLGVITKAVLKLAEAPISRNSAYAAFNDFDKVVQFMKFMDRGLAGTMSGYELIWGNTYQAMTSPPAQVNPPLPHGFKYYVLLESLGANQEKDRSSLQDLLELAFEQEMILDACIAQSQSDLDWFWTIREDVHVLKSQCHIDQHFDISLPISMIGEVVDKTTESLLKIDGVTKAFPFGHIADGNIHFIVDKVNDSLELKKEIDLVVYHPLKDLNGSVSAEHGIGVHKKAYLNISKSDEEIQLMKLIRKTMDPNNILNRGKIFD